MHATLLEWLQEFEKACNEKTPTTVYNHLVMLGVEMPNSGTVAPRSGNHSGCDCVQILADTRTNIQKAETDLDTWMRSCSDAERNRKREYISGLKKDEALYTSLHNSHAEYNRRAHEILVRTGMLAKVRACLLRDLRGGVRKTYDALPGETSASEYCRTVLKSYGELLKTFLVKTPEGWFNGAS